MRRWPPALALGWVVCAALGQGTSGNLCAADETVYFQCTVSKGRLLSVCGDAAKGKVQYRFGRPGHVEMAFPEKPQDAPSQLLYSHYFRAQTDRTEVRFENGGAGYVLFDYEEGARREAGVQVTTPSGKDVAIACNGPVMSRLSELKSVLHCDSHSALNLGQCP
jgi:hypothetical protein